VGSHPSSDVARAEILKIREIQWRLNKLSEGNCSLPCVPGTREIRALDFSNLQSGGAVWSRPSGMRKAAKSRKCCKFPEELFTLSEGKCSSGGPACPWSDKGDPGSWTSPTYRAGEQCGGARNRMRQAAEIPKIRLITRGEFTAFRGKVLFGGPPTPKVPKRRSGAWTSPTYRAGEQCGAARYRIPESGRNRKRRNSNGDFSQIQRESAVSGAPRPRSLKEIRIGLLTYRAGERVEHPLRTRPAKTRKRENSPEDFPQNKRESAVRGGGNVDYEKRSGDRLLNLQSGGELERPRGRVTGRIPENGNYRDEDFSGGSAA
jgi:hypothetical protein